MALFQVLVQIVLSGRRKGTHAAGEQVAHGVGHHVFVQLVGAVEALVAEVARVGLPVEQTMLEEVRPGREPLVAQVARVRLDPVVHVLVLHQDVLVAEAAVTDVALVGFPLLVGQLDVTHYGGFGGDHLVA